MTSSNVTRTRAVEFFLIFALLPPMLSALKPHGWIYITLWLGAALCYRTLRLRHGYSFRADWNAAALNAAALKGILLRFIPCAVLLWLFTLTFIPDHLFSLPLERPKLWVMVMVFYPLLSVIPQEIIFRSYFLHRYRNLFSPFALQMASALAFGWVHILLQNAVAVGFSAIGGLFFWHTYNKTRSLAAACAEHALYGCTVFTLGMGIYFYHGHAVQ